MTGRRAPPVAGAHWRMRKVVDLVIDYDNGYGHMVKLECGHVRRSYKWEGTIERCYRCGAQANP